MLANTQAPKSYSWIHQVAKQAEVRVSVIDMRGRVLADSALSTHEVVELPDHAGRPEFMAAVRTGVGVAHRYSETLNAEMVYAARKVGQSQPVIVRAAKPLVALANTQQNLRDLLMLSGVVGLLIALCLSLWAPRVFSRALQRVLNDVPAPAGVAPSSSGSFNAITRKLEHTLQSLAQQRDYLQTVLEGMDEAAIAVDRNGVITFTNQAALRMLDSKVSLRGSRFGALQHVATLNALVQKALQGETLEEEVQLQQGERCVLARAAPMQTAGGVLLIMHDLTRMRHLETVRRDFVANVSHELRTPISIIMANAETLQHGAMQDAKRGPGFVDAIARNAQRLSRLVLDLLDLSKIESDRYRLDIKPAELCPIVQRALHSLEPLLAQKRVEVHNNVPDGVRVQVDSGAMEQVLTNLLENGASYGPEGGVMRVEAIEDAHTVRLEVHDNGPGIPAEHRPRIFERFYRVDKGRARASGGTGLGLSIVKNLIESMQGEVGVEPATPQGSIFWVSLPKAKVSAQVQQLELEGTKPAGFVAAG